MSDEAERVALCCISCGKAIADRVVTYTEETKQRMSGDEYGWARWYHTDAAVCCSDDCLISLLAGDPDAETPKP